jgi:hypothetical protein
MYVFYAVATIASAVGAGMSYSASLDAAKTQSTFGLLNAQAGAQAARLQGRQAQLQSSIQAAGAKAQAATAANNAISIEKQTEAESRIAQENIRRSRQEFSNTFGKMRAGASASGVLETTGSPLDFLVKASEDQQLYEAEQRWQDENNRRGGFRKAQVERMSGTGMALNASLFDIQGQAELAAAKVRATQATMGGYAAQAEAAGTRSAATAGLVSNLGDTGMSAYNMYQNRTPRR